jgi:hypothetical protein
VVKVEMAVFLLGDFVKTLLVDLMEEMEEVEAMSHLKYILF